MIDDYCTLVLMGHSKGLEDWATKTSDFLMTLYEVGTRHTLTTFWM